MITIHDFAVRGTSADGTYGLAHLMGKEVYKGTHVIIYTCMSRYWIRVSIFELGDTSAGHAWDGIARLLKPRCVDPAVSRRPLKSSIAPGRKLHAILLTGKLRRSTVF